MDGKTLNFRLAGINNQNFLMRDEETGSYWQQISGEAIAGPLKGRKLELVPSDELSFALWKQENPNGSILAPTKESDLYAKPDWEQKIGKLPTVVSFKGLPDREIVMGMSYGGEDRAYPLAKMREQKVIQDRVGKDSVQVIALVLGPDGQSVRAFEARTLEGKSIEFFANTEKEWSLIDANSGSRWDFRGCGIDGPMKGTCLKRVNLIKDYWFDWRLYHPQTTIYAR